MAQRDTQTTAPQKEETKADKFIRLAENRVGKAIKSIATCETLANKSNYDFNSEQTGQIVAALQEQLNSLQSAFAAALEGKAAKKSTGFTLVKGPGAQA